MSEPSQSSTQRRVLTPLWVIALFISLTETVLGVGVIQTSGGIQITLTTFVLSFPLLIAGTFFFTLWKKPWVLYAPMEYGTGTDVKDFVREMSNGTRSLEELQVYTQIQQSIRDTLTSPDIILALSKTTARGEYTSRETVERILNDTATKAEENIRKQAFLTIDSRSFEHGEGHIWQVPYDHYTSVSALLDDLYWTLHSRDSSFPAYTFGKLWALRDVESGHVFKDMGRLWANTQGRGYDERALTLAGLKPGMILECFWL